MTVRVPQHGKPGSYVALNPKATEGATLGTDLRNADGSVLTLATLVNAADDIAAATAGVRVGMLYRNGSVLQIRVT